MMEGSVARLMSDKRFGFIKGNDGKDYFFHQSDFNGIWDDLVIDFDAGRKVIMTFDPIRAEKGLRAANVNRID